MADTHILDEETRKKLEGLTPFNAGTTFEFTPDIYDRLKIPSEARPVFSLRPLTVSEKASITLFIKNGDAKGMHETARKACIGWANLYDSGTGAAIPYTDEAGSASKDIFHSLPLPIKDAISGKLGIVSGVMDIEKVSLVY